MVVDWELAWKILLGIASLTGYLKRARIKQAFWWFIRSTGHRIDAEKRAANQALTIQTLTWENEDLRRELNGLLSLIEDQRNRALRIASAQGLDVPLERPSERSPQPPASSSEGLSLPSPTSTTSDECLKSRTERSSTAPSSLTSPKGGETNEPPVPA